MSSVTIFVPVQQSVDPRCGQAAHEHEHSWLRLLVQAEPRNQGKGSRAQLGSPELVALLQEPQAQAVLRIL